MARVDVIHGRQVASCGPASATPGPRLGAERAQAVPDMDTIGIQALQHVRSLTRVWKEYDKLTRDRVKPKYSPWTPVAKARQ
jgi:hypothetical protein